MTVSMDILDVVNCPLCGRRPTEVLDFDLRYRFRCVLSGDGGKCIIEGNPSTDRDEAAAMWNRYVGEIEGRSLTERKIR
jgi:hypothetical protein